MNEQLLMLNDLKESSRLRLENLKKKCKVIKSIVLKHKDLFPNGDQSLMNVIMTVEEEV